MRDLERRKAGARRSLAQPEQSRSTATPLPLRLCQAVDKVCASQQSESSQQELVSTYAANQACAEIEEHEASVSEVEKRLQQSSPVKTSPSQRAERLEIGLLRSSSVPDPSKRPPRSPSHLPDWEHAALDA
eukprot:3085653-Rhodomonas_salina.1